MTNAKCQRPKVKESREKVQVEAKAKVKAGVYRLEVGGGRRNAK
jgi:hypothetical protein